MYFHADRECKPAISRVTLNGANKPFYFEDNIAESGLLRVSGEKNSTVEGDSSVYPTCCTQRHVYTCSRNCNLFNNHGSCAVSAV
jgi:hypothetical protein